MNMVEHIKNVSLKLNGFKNMIKLKKVNSSNNYNDYIFGLYIYIYREREVNVCVSKFKKKILNSPSKCERYINIGI